MEKKIIVRSFDGSEYEIEPDPSENLARQLFLKGAFKDVPLCSGIGRCGLCKVRFESKAPEPQKEEIQRLTDTEILSGWRFSCLHAVCEAEIFVPEPRKTVPPKKNKLSETAAGSATLAVDLGTTSICWAITDGINEISSGKELNPQTGLGSEVMSRLSFGAKPENRAVLAGLITARMKSIISESEIKIDHIVISGNPSMASILVQDDLTGLSRAPYRLPRKGGETIILDAALPPAYMPSHLAPFVGADITAGITALEFGAERPKPPYLLADLGTNGEFILCTAPDKFLAASVPMGPALEGLGLSCGMTAGPGAISAFKLSPAGLSPEFAVESADGKELGITGTGYLSLCAALLKSGLLAQDGSFAESRTPLAARLGRSIMSVHGSPALVLGPDLLLTAADIEEILKVKAAFNLAASTLLSETKLAPSSLNSILLAGAMGQYVNVNDLLTTGFLPNEAGPMTRAVGNTSLQGSVILAGNKKAREYAMSLPDKTSVINLAGGETFGKKFLERMIFKYVY